MKKDNKVKKNTTKKPSKKKVNKYIKRFNFILTATEILVPVGMIAMEFVRVILERKKELKQMNTETKDKK